MSSKTSSARSIRRPDTRRRSRNTRGTQPVAARVVRALWNFSRPRTVRELATLVLVLLGAATLVSSGVAGLLRGDTPLGPVVWCALLLIAALATRLWPLWQAEWRALTRERIRAVLGAALLLYVAAALSWHLIAGNLNLGNRYLLPQPLDRAPLSIFVLLLVGSAAVLVTAGFPIHQHLGRMVQGGSSRFSGLRSRDVVAYADVASLPRFSDESVSADGENRQHDVKETGFAVAANGHNSLLGSGRTKSPILPPLSTFIPAPKGPTGSLDVDHIARRIEETLASFNVAARVVDHHKGPVVTQFDVQPDRGVKVRRITELQNDLALALAAPTIRIQAPIPGKPFVGIEIPNTTASVVALRELLESEQYRALKSPLKVALGKDVAGHPAIIDLAKMPHLLIAGATGSGKSVCVNAIISCLLTENSPEQVRLVMVDPKMVELTVYNGVPHLLSPVVTQMDKVIGVLQWALREMERRYQLFAHGTVRNIGRYNEKQIALGAKPLPYIVLIIDELADLMMMAPEDVEDAVCRLAQLARAAGIHLVIATQRPSVDVVTGLIKANFPARIAFAMTSQVDSRTILDSSGAEKLLGRGDMLYMPPDAPKPVRLQGAHVTDQEIERLVEFWQRSPLQEAVQRVADEEFLAASKAASQTDDDLLGEATRVVREFNHASVSLLQRRMRVGYARAARLMDQLEAHGVVGPADGSKQRPVLDGKQDES